MQHEMCKNKNSFLTQWAHLILSYIVWTINILIKDLLMRVEGLFFATVKDKWVVLMYVAFLFWNYTGSEPIKANVRKLQTSGGWCVCVT